MAEVVRAEVPFPISLLILVDALGISENYECPDQENSYHNGRIVKSSPDAQGYF
jgi:hypothetical protein